MDIDRSELKDGLARTRRYLLSHHEPAEWYRCYTIDRVGEPVRLCARCSGVYPGIGLGLVGYITFPIDVSPLLLVGVCPLPAIIDWALTTFTERRGHNLLRTVTGALLGYGYGLGAALLLLESNLRVAAIGVGYGSVAALLVYASIGRGDST